MAAAADSFVDKWLARDPGLQLLPVFLPLPQRTVLPLWLSLLSEFDEAMFEASDPAVTRTKLAWWAEELAAGAPGARHPLAQALFAAWPQSPAPTAELWRRLAVAAIELAEHEDSPADWDESDRRWRALAQVVAEIEQCCSGHACEAALVAGHWRLMRCFRALQRGQIDRAGLPMQLWARHPQVEPGTLATSSAGLLWQEIGQRWLPANGLPDAGPHRHLLSRLDALRLRRLAAGASLQQAWPLSPLRALWEHWRAARGALRG